MKRRSFCALVTAPFLANVWPGRVIEYATNTTGMTFTGIPLVWDAPATYPYWKSQGCHALTDDLALDTAMRRAFQECR